MSDEPRKGDKIRLVYEGTVDYWSSTGGAIEGGDHWYHTHPSYGFKGVEVLERADDPAKDAPGTVRLERHKGGEGHSIWLRSAGAHVTEPWLCIHSTDVGNIGCRLGDRYMVGNEVIGSAPGTPAAEAA